MSTPPPSKRQKASSANNSPRTATVDIIPISQAPIAPRILLDTAPPLPPPPVSSSPNPRKRRASGSPKFNTLPPGIARVSEPIPFEPRPAETRPTESKPPESRPPESRPPESGGAASVSIPALLAEDPNKRVIKRTNTPWTAAEEQRLKQMRDGGNSWSEIAKAFPNRTEGSVKKHWYKDMHYAEFAEDETHALREAIKEYEANKWKVIGQKLGKPAKACEQFAREHFKNL